jgi:hypothetical protein
MKQRILAFLAALLLLPGLVHAKIFLADTDDTLRVVTASGVSTIHMYAAWADLTTTALTPGNSDAQVTTATTTVLVAAPGASTQRQIKGLSIRNAHASSSNLITVQFFDGATATELLAYTLLAGETLQWGEDENFRVIDASGQVKGAVASTQSGTWNITNVSGTVSLPTGAATAANQDGIIKDGSGDTTQANVSSGSLHVACQSGCSGGTQYAEDTVHSSGDTLTLAGVVRSDATAALAADGDRTVLQVNSDGHLKVVNTNPNLAADNSTLSTAKTPVLAGTVSTSAPTWTNGNQSALSLQTDGSVRSAVTNTVTVSASNLDVQIGGSDSLTIGTFPDNEPFNIAQMNGVTVSMGVGASGTGTQRVASLIHDGTDTAQVTATSGGSLQVECTAGCAGSGGTSIADDAAFTPGTTSVTPAGAMFDDVTPDSVNEGDAGVVRMSANRNLYSTIRDAAGNERGANVNASNELLVNPGTVTIGTFPDNEPFNIAQMNGVTVLMGAGNTGTGSQRVTEATDSQLSAGVGATGDAAATAGSTGSITAKLRLATTQLDAIQTAVQVIDNAISGTGVNVSQINGVTPLMGAGNTGTGSPRVTIATDQAALPGMGIYVEDAGETAGGNLTMAGSVRRDTAASSAGTTGDNATINTDASGLLWTRTIDPCSSVAKTFLPFSITTATTTEITPSLAGASTNYYVCSLVLVTNATNIVTLVDDDSDGCGSPTSGLSGGTTTAGWTLAANGGLTFGNGMGSVFKTAGTNRVICLVTSATTQLSGTMTVVAAP